MGLLEFFAIVGGIMTIVGTLGGAAKNQQASLSLQREVLDAQKQAYALAERTLATMDKVLGELQKR